jgi:hypothetical protein
MDDLYNIFDEIACHYSAEKEKRIIYNANLKYQSQFQLTMPVMY